ncbi:MAG: winged helix DNA-binding domain-containing protein, partial [Actinomycetota bacterium]|nr:winged helix DNA-binding domain-containing protein [Actinomycetota bacterium]
AVSSYPGAHGPARAAAFDHWLCRGTSKKASLRAWSAQLGDRLTTVDVEGDKIRAHTEDVGDLVDAVPDDTIRLLPAFDQYVPGPGTNDVHVTGTWNVTKDRLKIQLFGEHGDSSRGALTREVERVASVAATSYTMSVRTI